MYQKQSEEIKLLYRGNKMRTKDGSRVSLGLRALLIRDTAMSAGVPAGEATMFAKGFIGKEIAAKTAIDLHY